MLALGLVATAVLAIMSVYTLGLRQSSNAEQVLKATEYGREILERCKELEFAQIPDTDVTFDGRVPTPASGGFPPDPYPERSDLEAMVIVDQIAPQLKSVYVRVYYEKGRSIDFQTYLKP